MRHGNFVLTLRIPLNLSDNNMHQRFSAGNTASSVQVTPVARGRKMPIRRRTVGPRKRKLLLDSEIELPSSQILSQMKHTQDITLNSSKHLYCVSRKMAKLMGQSHKVYLLSTHDNVPRGMDDLVTIKTLMRPIVEPTPFSAEKQDMSPNILECLERNGKYSFFSNLISILKSSPQNSRR